ncbi:HAD family phosphatase [Novosphingobium sp. G106]|nr:HAD family phosphatase [Novosphingobium sp. G106]MBV1686797.1 HAD family phosphatase [Novosphingobium sp. G106]
MVFPRAVEAVVFDMDGLLFDTEELFFQAMRAAGAEAGHDVSRTFFLGLVGLPADRNFERMRNHFGADFPAEAFHACCHDHFHVLEHRMALKPGVIELLDRIDQLHLPRAIATSSARENVERNLDRFGLAHRFDASSPLAITHMASRIRHPISRRPRRFVWRRLTAWRWRIRTTASDRPRRRG